MFLNGNSARPNGDWEKRALCLDPETWDYFFPNQGEWEKVQKAKELCEQCPVQRECLQAAFSYPETHGIWAGTTAEERKIVRRLQRQLDSLNRKKTGCEESES